jgi:surface protein
MEKLESIDVSMLNTSSVESMAGLFKNCKLFTSIDISIDRFISIDIYRHVHIYGQVVLTPG